MTTECNIEHLLDNLKNDGAFDCEHSRESVKDYFKGQCDAIESVVVQINKLIEGINIAKNNFTEIIEYAKSLDKNKCNHETEH